MAPKSPPCSGTARNALAGIRVWPRPWATNTSSVAATTCSMVTSDATSDLVNTTVSMATLRPPRSLEVALPRRPREWDHVADVLDAGRVDDRALEAEAEAGVGHGAVAAQVAVPVVVRRVEP